MLQHHQLEGGKGIYSKLYNIEKSFWKVFTSNKLWFISILRKR